MRTYPRRYDYTEIRRLLAETDRPCWHIAAEIGCSTSLVQRINQGRTGREMRPVKEDGEEK